MSSATPAAKPNWQLPWHYLGGPICLLHSISFPVLIERLNKKEEEDLKRILQPDQARQDEKNPALFDEVAQVGKDYPKTTLPLYDWTMDWPENLALCLRRMPHLPIGHDFILTRKALILRWPFREDQGLQYLDGVPPIGDLEAGLPNPKTDFHSFAFMRVADELITHRRGDFSKPSPNPAKDPLDPVPAEAKVRRDTEHEERGSPGVPEDDSALDVVPDKTITTMASRWEGYGDRLRLVLGWVEVPRPGQPFPFDTWPCGAFTDF
jgi:hypothetical protein